MEGGKRKMQALARGGYGDTRIRLYALRRGIPAREEKLWSANKQILHNSRGEVC